MFNGAYSERITYEISRSMLITNLWHVPTWYRRHRLLSNALIQFIHFLFTFSMLDNPNFPDISCRLGSSNFLRSLICCATVLKYKRMVTTMPNSYRNFHPFEASSSQLKPMYFINFSLYLDQISSKFVQWFRLQRNR